MASHPFSLTSRKTLNNNLSIPLIHLGVYLMSNPEASAATTHALDAGYRAIDSAQMYNNEAAVSKAIRAWLEKHPDVKREDVHYTTKLATNGSYEEARRSVKKSVEVSGLGYVDLFLLHSPYGGKKARLESWRALEDAVDEGSVKSIGVSNFGEMHIDELLASSPRIEPAVNQIEVHPFNTHSALTAHCTSKNIAIEAYAPLARALRMKHPVIVELANKYECTPAQLMVRWSLQKGFVTLPKSVRRERIVENAEVNKGGLVKGIEDGDMKVLEGCDEGLVTDEEKQQRGLRHEPADIPGPGTPRRDPLVRPSAAHFHRRPKAERFSFSHYQPRHPPNLQHAPRRWPVALLGHQDLPLPDGAGALQDFAATCSNDVKSHIRHLLLRHDQDRSATEWLWGSSWPPASLAALSAFNKLTTVEIDVEDFADAFLDFDFFPQLRGGRLAAGVSVDALRKAELLDALYGVQSRQNPQHVRHSLAKWVEEPIWPFWGRDALLNTIPAGTLTSLKGLTFHYVMLGDTGRIDKRITALDYVRDLCSGEWDINPFASRNATTRTQEDDDKADLWMEARAARHWDADVAAAGEYTDGEEAHWCPWSFEWRVD